MKNQNSRSKIRAPTEHQGRQISDDVQSETGTQISDDVQSETGTHTTEKNDGDDVVYCETGTRLEINSSGTQSSPPKTRKDGHDEKDDHHGG
jgi:hypothetical protein